MSLAAYISTFNPVLDDNGSPLAGGQLYFNSPGLSEPKQVFSSPFLDTPLSYPVVLDDSGRFEVWMSGDYDLVLHNAADELIYTRTNVNPDTAGAQTGINLILNGSFEDNVLGDNKTPDNWTLAEEAGSTTALDADSVAGTNAFCSTSTGNGGANIISENFFEVTGSDALTVSFFIKSSVVDVRNLVQFKWYDAAKTLIQTDTLYDNSTTNPTAWTRQIFTATAPATARFGKMQFYAAHTSDPTSGQTCYDSVEVFPSSLGGAFASGTILSFLQNAAPSGWTFSASFADRLPLFATTEITGGDLGGSWTISGLSGTAAGVACSFSLQVNVPLASSVAGPAGVSFAAPGVVGVTGTITKPAQGVTVSQNGAWRPLYVKSIPCVKD